ncbi:hypothetical protein MCM1_1746 [Methanosarcina barkeri CM1]|uniref:Uncharacterized protein n=1 Tax=Methanosarcina barkeri CM1 TaxID=796385 RepID=A0A0G3CDF1_METBA|nr:hypothetical protein MCM1_1746 [Methanosarcina barkeri CM1]
MEKLLSEEIKLIKPVFTFIKNPKNKESLRLLFLFPIFLFLIMSPGAAASSNWELTPQNPVVGDTIEIKGTGFEGDTVEVQVAFEKKVEVQDGEYAYQLEDVVIPSGSDNSFVVKAIGADDLNVRAKMLLWLTKSAEAKDGTATVFQAHVPSGTYKIRIDGKASGSSVKLRITAVQKIEVDSDGSISYQYNTKSIPAGNFEVKVDGITKKIELQPSESLSSETNSSEQNSSEEDVGGITEKIKEEIDNGKNISSEEKKFADDFKDLKSQKIWIAGILAVLILFVVYLGRKKS